MIVEAIIPAAGLATRMRGLPKFLLPINDQFETLLEWHVHQIGPYCDRIRIPTRPELRRFIDALDFGDFDVVVTEVESRTMSETVTKAISASDENFFVLAMPDTFFLGNENVFELLLSHSDPISAAIFRIQDFQRGKVGQVELKTQSDGTEVISRVVDKNPDCNFPWMWGAITFDRSLMEYSTPEDPHLGYALARAAQATGVEVRASRMESRYFDCGTPGEYWNLLQHLHSSIPPRGASSRVGS